MMRKTGFIWQEIYMWHDTGTHAGVLPAGVPVQPGRHAENPETKRRFKNLLEVSGLYKQLHPVEAYPASEEDILRVHTCEYMNRIKAMSDETGGDAGMLTPFGKGGFDIAKLAAGGVMAAIDAVLDSKIDNAYALVRPPGHHAEPDMGKGFCLFSNAAIAAKYAQAKRGVGKIAFVDWDVHHGNGAEKIFWNDPSVLTISIHQDRCFPPDSGDMCDNGSGDGAGYNINIPLPAGSGVGAYEAAYDRVIIPALYKFKPDLIIVPSGFDAGAHDPLGRMMMHSEGYRSLTEKLMTAADDLCSGRVVMCHEGGYNDATVPFFGLAVMESLSGIRTQADDPFMALFGALAGQELQPHQDQVIKAAEKLLGNLKS
ncbi:Deacetylases, including yeast histone deacetylase and acetoin utilization protein [hydrothermal vent metagenome]|uniref:Deacetylases, including yeast histone deacetylase and acetoin utilization protein n=1 Tax=hydrothermal vent metagenome TaxID=652676 RepID=A0A3B0SW19_9ZZZZ